MQLGRESGVVFLDWLLLGQRSSRVASPRSRNLAEKGTTTYFVQPHSLTPSTPYDIIAQRRLLLNPGPNATNPADPGLLVSSNAAARPTREESRRRNNRDTDSL